MNDRSMSNRREGYWWQTPAKPMVCEQCGRGLRAHCVHTKRCLMPVRRER